MVIYSCEKCGKEFSQKGHYTKHLNKKNPCVVESKIKEMLDKVVEEKLNKVFEKLNINENTEEVIINTKVISLFTGIGGMDMGFDGEVIVHKDSIINKEFIDKPYTINDFVVLKKNNFDCVFQNDILKGAKEVFGFNNDNSKYNTTSIYNLISENFVFPKADIVIGGFPCQDFSHAGKRKGFKSNKGHDLKEKVDIKKKTVEEHCIKVLLKWLKKFNQKCSLLKMYMVLLL